MKLKQYFFLIIMISSFTQPIVAKEFIIGADISALAVLEQEGAVYRQDDSAQELFDILKNNGFNTIRLRLFVNPDMKGIVTNNLPYTLKLAKRAKAHNMKLLLNFHYSDTWADPNKQIKPAAWENLSFDQLKQTVQDYTASVIKTFKEENCLPDFVQIGNEITPGMLWPDGKVSSQDDNEIQWQKFTSLLKAGIEGVRTAAPHNNIKIMLHIDQGGKKSVSEWFFSHINKYQVPYDIIGISFYPWWHGTIENLKENLNYIATNLKKDVMVVETAYPHTEKIDWHGHPPKPDELAMPMSPQGQYDMLYLITKTVIETPDKHGCGVFYWFPESVPVKKQWLAGSAALFDENGNALPGIHSFADAAGIKLHKR